MSIFKKNIKYILMLFVFVGLILLIIKSLGPKDLRTLKKESKIIINDVKDKCLNDSTLGYYHVEKYEIKNGKLYNDLNQLINTYDSDIEGTIIVEKNCDLTYEIYNYLYKIIKNQKDLKIIKEHSKVNKATYKGKLEIGSEVTINKNVFNVIEINDDEIKLLSKYNINELLKQDINDNSLESKNPFSFDEANNRSSSNNTFCQRSLYGCNMYDKYDGVFTNGNISGEINEVSTIKYIVDRYALLLELESYLKGARLITKEELKSLGCSDSSCIDSIYKFIYDTTYWTSSYFGSSPSIVYRVQSDGVIGSIYANYSNTTGIRPLIIVSKELF